MAGSEDTFPTIRLADRMGVEVPWRPMPARMGQPLYGWPKCWSRPSDRSSDGVLRVPGGQFSPIVVA